MPGQLSQQELREAQQIMARLKSQGQDVSKYEAMLSSQGGMAQPQAQPQQRPGNPISGALNSVGGAVGGLGDILGKLGINKNSILSGLQTAGVGLAGKDYTPDSSDDIAKLYQQEAIKRSFEPNQGFSSPDEIPKEMNGLPLKGVSYKSGQWVPDYGQQRPLVEFSGLDPDSFNVTDEGGDTFSSVGIPQPIRPINTPQEAPIASVGQPQPQDDYTDEELSAFAQEALAAGVPQEQIQSKMNELRASRQQPTVASLRGVQITQQGIQNALAAGYSQEEIDSVINAQRKGY